MNGYRFAVVLMVGIFASHAYSEEKPQQQQLPTELLPRTQESPELQAIRWRLALSCNQNSDCAARDVQRANDRRMLASQAPAGESPSTMERRRALGLIK